MLDRVARGEAVGDDIVPVVYEELRSLAASLLRGQRAGHTLQPTALVHEAYVRLFGRRPEGDPWASRHHFFAVAAKAMRQILVNHAEARAAQKRGGAWHRVTLSAVDTPASALDVDLVALNEALERLERLDPRQCRIVELRFFGGMTVEETADALGISPRTVKLDWRMARAWLHERLDDGAAG